MPFTQLSLNDLENRYLVTTKLRSKSSAIVSRGNLEAFNTLIAEARAGGHANEQATALSMFLLRKQWQLRSSSSFTSLLIYSLEIHLLFWGIEAYLRRIRIKGMLQRGE